MTEPAVKLPQIVSSGQSAENAMDQVRDLLFGDAQRRSTDRFNHLEDQMRESDRAIARRFEELERRLREAEARAEERRRESLAEIGAALIKLGEHVKRLGVDPHGGRHG